MTLVWPAMVFLSSYATALEQGWTPDNARPQGRLEQLARIKSDPAGFLAEQVDRDARGPSILLPDGEVVPRLPGYMRWMWDGEFCGSIGFRWKPGTTDLPPHCLGHIGYSVVAWKRGRGYATRALGLLLPDARAEGLAFVELVTDESNFISQRVIIANGGRLVEHFRKPAAYGGSASLRFRIDLE